MTKITFTFVAVQLNAVAITSFVNLAHLSSLLYSAMEMATGNHINANFTLAAILLMVFMVMWKRHKKKMQIFVRLSGNTIIVNIEPGMSIGRLKRIVENKEGITVQQQTLFYAGKILRDKTSLRDYNIHKDATIHLKESRLLGGMNGLSSPEPTVTRSPVYDQTLEGFVQRAVLRYIEEVVHVGDRPTRKRDAKTETVALHEVQSWIVSSQDSALDVFRSRVTIDSVRTGFTSIDNALNIPWNIDFLTGDDVAGSVGITYNASSWNLGSSASKMHKSLSSVEYDPAQQPQVMTNPSDIFSAVLGQDNWYGRLTKTDILCCAHEVLLAVSKCVFNENEDGISSHDETNTNTHIAKKTRVRTSLEGTTLTLHSSTPKKKYTPDKTTTAPASKTLKDCLTMDLTKAASAALTNFPSVIKKAELISRWQADVLSIDLQTIRKLDNKVKRH